MLAKRILYISMEELEELLNLPKGVEIISSKKSLGFEEGYEFVIASGKEVFIEDVQITSAKDNPQNITRIRLSTLVDALRKEEMRVAMEMASEDTECLS